ncbi:reverse transcriptase domain-containing protein [Tanacetum coccineum]
MTKRHSKEAEMTRAAKVIGSALDAETLIILSENVRNHRRTRTKGLSSKVLGVIAAHGIQSSISNEENMNDVGTTVGPTLAGNTPGGNEVDVVVPVESIRAISDRFANMAYGFFSGKRVAYPVVANYVRNTWVKYGLVRLMLNSSTGILSFQFSSMDGLDAMLENGSWFIHNNPLILKKWNPDVNLLKEDVVNVLVWVKLHGVPVTAFSEDGLSAIATKLGNPLMLDSYTSDMCIQSWGRSSYARELIEVRVDVELKDNIVVDECPKIIKLDVVKNMKKPSQTLRGVLVGPKVGFQPTKKVYRHIPKKNNVSTSGNKNKDAEPTKEVSKSNSFDVLNSVKNDVDLGTNDGTSNLTNKKANSSGSSFWNVESSSTSTTPIVEKIDKMERLIIDRTDTLMDDEGILLKRVNSSGYHDSDDEVASVDNDMANFLASKDVGYVTNSLLEQWKESYGNGEYDYDPYNDDIYEGWISLTRFKIYAII